MSLNHNNRGKIISLLFIFSLALWMDDVYAEKLVAQNWNATNNLGIAAQEVFDNNLRTSAVSNSTILEEKLFFSLDLGRPYLLHRIFFAGPRLGLPKPKSMEVDFSIGVEQDNFTKALYPEKIFVYVGNTPDTLKCVAETTVPKDVSNEISFDGDIRFQPVVARYIRLMTAECGNGYKWHIAEIELFGSADSNGFKPRDAVLVDKNAPAPLLLAADELSYYITELTNAYVPVSDPSDSENFTGTLYRIVDLKPFARTWKEMDKNRKAGKLPENINVEKNGQEVIFRAWPYKNVLYSVWEFLRQQGVRWVYPGSHGDFVPVGKGINLDILPLRYTPSSPRRYASFGISKMRGQAYLFWWRNGFDETWGHGEKAAIGGAEMPLPRYPPLAAAEYPSDYTEGINVASPHTLASVVPWRIVKKHADWIARDSNGEPVKKATCCMTSPGVIDFVVKKALAITNHRDSCETIRIVPMDGCRWCLCKRCQKLDGPPIWDEKHSTLASSFSESYFYFINEVAKRLIINRPHMLIQAMAYSNHYRPPKNIKQFSPNVRVQCMVYGSRYLPMESPANVESRKIWQMWREKVTHLAYYDHFLIHPGQAGYKNTPELPLPGVAAIVSRAKFLNKIDALWGEIEGRLAGLPYNPWNYYAYARLLWDASLTEDVVLKEFFPAFFAEATEPMLAYYKVLENDLVQRNIDCTGASPGVYTLPIIQEMGTHLAAAESIAESWLIKERVANIRKSYNELLRRLNLKGRDLTDLSTLPQIGSKCEELTISPAQLWIQQGYVKRNDDIWQLGNVWCKLGTYVGYEEDGNYVLTIIAKAKPSGDICPSLRLIIGDEYSETLKINSIEYKKYAFNIRAKAGYWLTLLYYRKTKNESDKNIYVKDIRVAYVDPK